MVAFFLLLSHRDLSKCRRRLPFLSSDACAHLTKPNRVTRARYVPVSIAITPVPAREHMIDSYSFVADAPDLVHIAPERTFRQKVCLRVEGSRSLLDNAARPPWEIVRQG